MLAVLSIQFKYYMDQSKYIFIHLNKWTWIYLSRVIQVHSSLFFPINVSVKESFSPVHKAFRGSNDNKLKVKGKSCKCKCTFKVNIYR